MWVLTFYKSLILHTCISAYVHICIIYIINIYKYICIYNGCREMSKCLGLYKIFTNASKTYFNVN